MFKNQEFMPSFVVVVEEFSLVNNYLPNLLEDQPQMSPFAFRTFPAFRAF